MSLSAMLRMPVAKLVPDDWIKTPYNCPLCKRSLYYTADRAGATVWCPWPSVPNNEGTHCNEATGHGITLEKAVIVLMAKMGIGKYDPEVVETPDPTDENTPAVKPESKKRGRKVKGAKDEPMAIPVGEFTIKDFCTLNSTYPVKALAFIKTVDTIQKVGHRSSGRGKPAMVYINKI